MLIPFIKAIDFHAKLIKNDGLPPTIQHFLYCCPNKKKTILILKGKGGNNPYFVFPLLSFWHNLELPIATLAV